MPRPAVFPSRETDGAVCIAKQQEATDLLNNFRTLIGNAKETLDGVVYFADAAIGDFNSGAFYDGREKGFISRFRKIQTDIGTVDGQIDSLNSEIDAALAVIDSNVSKLTSCKSKLTGIISKCNNEISSLNHNISHYKAERRRLKAQKAGVYNARGY